MRCTQCGYDMTGPELLANKVDASSQYAHTLHAPKALLNMCTRSETDIPCPFCHSVGTWIN